VFLYYLHSKISQNIVTSNTVVIRRGAILFGDKLVVLIHHDLPFRRS